MVKKNEEQCWGLRLIFLEQTVRLASEYLITVGIINCLLDWKEDS